jgi:hypothetical protein
MAHHLWSQNKGHAESAVDAGGRHRAYEEAASSAMSIRCWVAMK